VRIAIVCDWYAPRLGGIESQLAELSARLVAAGHEVHVVTPTVAASSDVGPVVVHRIDTPRAPRFGFLCTPGGVRAIGRVLADGAFDVVHSHVSIISPAAFAGGAHAHRLDLPSVVTFHSYIPATRAFMRAVAMVTGSRRWKATFTAVSRKVAHEVAPISPRPIEILPNGIDAKFWRASTSATRIEDRISLVSVLRLNRKKRPRVLLDVASTLRARIGTRFRLTIAGDGPLLQSLRREIERRQLGDIVQLVGRVSREQLRDLYQSADVFVLPTIRESFGLAALEAKTAGLPVVAMRDSAVAEQVEHGVNGLLATSDADLASCVKRLIDDSGLRESIGLVNRTSPVANDWAVVIERHLEVYAGAREEADPSLRSG
jgi:glycosyltransferase involved in cell wall biosynthesis